MVGSAVASNIVGGIFTYWNTLRNFFYDQAGEFLWSAFQWSKGISLPVRLVRDPPQHKFITRPKELTQLKELFGSFDKTEAVYAVYLVGLPGSGKSELARQYGNLVFESGNVSTVITLNTESEERFKHDLIEALLELKAAKGTEATKEVFSKNTIDHLFDQLQLFLRERPGWLLIVDNIRDRSTTQR